MKGQSTILLNTLVKCLGWTPREDLLQQTGLSRTEFSAALTTCVRSGAVLVSKKRIKATKAGLERLQKDGALLAGHRGPVFSSQPSAWPQRLWKAVRVKRRGTAADFVLLAARPSDADPLNQSYILLRAWARAGFLLVQEKAVDGQNKFSNRLNVFVLVKDPGPLTPQYHRMRRRVFDPNSGAIHELA